MDFPIFENPGHRNAGKSLLFWAFRNIGNPISENPDFPEIRTSGIFDFRTSIFAKARISGASDVDFVEASDARHRMGPDPSKKHGDVLEPFQAA